MRIVWTLPAKFYLKEILAYHKEVAGAKVSKKIKEALLSAPKQLINFQELGSIEEFEPYEYRSIITGHYKIIYRIVMSNIYIIDVFDTRQNPEKVKRNL